MFSKFTLIGSLLLASVTLAAPSSGTKERLARRRENHQSKPVNRVDPPASNISDAVIYSSSWSGAVVSAGAGTFTTVTGTFTVPNVSGAEGSGAAIWVGIDGDTCQNAILQTGVDVIISGGVPQWSAWYEWYPDYSYDFSGITVSPGDVIVATVTASSTTSGTATIENLTTGVTVMQALTSSYALCEQDADWIVEDFEEGSSFIPLACFTVTFTNATATGPSGIIYTPSSGTIIDIEQNNVILTDAQVVGSGLTVTTCT